MNEIAYSLYSNDTEKAIKYAIESSELSDRLEYRKGKAVSLWVTGLVYSKSDKQAAMKHFQESLAIAESLNDQTIICNCLLAIGNMQKDFGEVQKSDESYDRALKIASKIEDRDLLLKCLVNIARNHSGKGEYEKAIEVLKESIQLAQELKANSVLSKALNNLAWIYSTRSNHSPALEYYLKALKINEELNNQSAMVINYLNIAGIQSAQREYDAALNYAHEALNISEEIGDSLKVSMCFLAIGSIYMKINDSISLEYYEKSLQIIGDNNKTQVVNTLVNMGTVYSRQKEFTKAINHFNEALLIAEEIGLKRAIGKIWGKIGSVHIHQKRYAEALKYTNKSLDIAKELNLVNRQKELYGQLSEIYAAINNYQAAYQNHILYKIYNDSVFNENNIKKLANLESAYKYEKEKQVYEIEAQNRELRIKSQRGIIILLIIAFILFLLLGIMATRSYKLKKQLLRLELEEANAELERNQKEMTSATLKLVQTAERDVRSIKMLENIEKNTNPEVQNEIKSLIFDYKSQAYNSNWEEFEIQFQKVHTSFYKNLNANYPTLTLNERKLCVFLKLNMTNKQIAQITFQSEDALKKARHRLRKKLAIEQEANLVSFIQNI